MPIPLIGGLIAGAGALLGYKSSKDANKSAEEQQRAAIEAAKMDPRFERMLWGDGSPENQGLLAQYMAQGNQPQLEGLKQFGLDQSNYIGQNGMADMQAMRGAANGLMGSNINAPTMQAAQMQTTLNGPASQASVNHGGMGLMSQGSQAQGAQSNAYQSQAAQANPVPGVGTYGTQVQWNTGESYDAPAAMQAAQVGTPQQVGGATMAATAAQASQVNAPKQNSMDLTGSYDRFINGAPGQNQFLQQGIDGAIASNRLGFNQLLDDSTRNLNENVLGGIRSNSVLSGQYGGSRQGIAEGRAIGDTMREQSRAASMFGQNATNAGVAAQSQAYESDSNRALSATQGLGAQQYGVAQQNSAQQQQANLANAAAQNQASQTNAGFGQQAALANQSANLQAGTTNANLTQQAGLNNYAGQLSATAGSAGNRQQANLANQSAGNNAAMFNATQGQNASLQNANLNQSANQFNAGLAQQTNLANQGALNSNSQFNANLGQNNSQYNAGLGQANSQFNTGQQNNMSQFNANASNNMGQFNAGQQQQNNQYNTSATNSGNQYNAGLMQQGLLANQSSQQNTNQLNSANQLGGIGANSGLLSSALQGAQNQDGYALNRNSQMLSMIGGLANRQNTPVAQPLYSNTAGNVLGGAMAGLGLYKQFAGNNQNATVNNDEFASLYNGGVAPPRFG